MKKIILAIAIVLLVAAGLVAKLVLTKRTPENKEVQVALSEKDKELAALRAEKECVERQLQDFAKSSDELMTHAAARQSALSNALAAEQALAKDGTPTGKRGLGNMIKGMLEDPEMKQMIMSQQRMMVGQLYGPLVQKLGLTPDQATAFKDLLANNMAKATEVASTFMTATGKVDRVQMGKEMAETTKAFESQIKEMLGEQGYAEYQNYQMTVGERAQLGMFRQETMGGAEPVSEQQIEQLLQMMADEKKAASAALGVNAGPDAMGQLAATGEEEQMSKLLTLQETVNRNVYDKAGGVLSESQLAAFGRHQSNQLQMIRFGINMARKMMSPEAE